jgi:DNA helicase-2/ATP-dependent DNA helicase PcrA
MDFDDLLMRVTFAFRSHPKMLDELQERYQYILIDEYQDTNHAQYILAHALAHKHRNLCVVGDPDQSIYAWRGADIQNILDFEQDYRDAVVVKLERNYRSTPTILKAASRLIAHNTHRKDKKLWTDNPDGAKIAVIRCQDEHDEALAVTERLKALNEQGMAWSGMAIFYRINALSRVMEDALRKAGVPYQIARGVEFYNRREIKDVMAYLRAVANPQDELSLTRIINTPSRGISEGTVKTLQALAVSEQLTLWEALGRVERATGLSPRAVKSVQAFVAMIESFRRFAASRPSSKSKGAVQTIMETVLRHSGLDAYYRKEDPDGEDQYGNLNELINAAAEFDRENPQATLDDYLSAISLVSDIDRMEGAGGAVTLMTLHAAKGLEFPAVAMIGLEEGCLPHARARANPKEMEEERRLCFVGITRAQQRLILTHAACRTLRGLRERTVTSPFLSELPDDALEHTDRTGLPGGSGDARGWSSDRFSRNTDHPEPRFRTGQMVRHPTFGVGKVATISKMGQHTRAVVEFPRAGRKTLILEFARLEAVG